MAIKVITLKPSNWQEFRQMRVYAVKTETNLLSGDWEQMARLPDSYWIDTLSNPDTQIFALLNDKKMVGMAAVRPFWEDKTGTVGYLCWNYVMPKFRGGGNGKLLNNARMHWAKHVRKYKSICFSCRENNVQSQAIHKRSGFEYSHSFESQFGDGMATEFFYKMDLADYDC